MIFSSWYSLAVIVALVIGFIAFANDSGFGVFVAYLGVAGSLYGLDYNMISYTLNNPFYTAFSVGGVLFLGFVWSMFKYFRHLKKIAEQIAVLKTKANPWKADDPQGDYVRWAESTKEQIRSLARYSSFSSMRSEILFWMWSAPFSILEFALWDVVANVFTNILNLTKGFYIRMYNKYVGADLNYGENEEDPLKK